MMCVNKFKEVISIINFLNKASEGGTDIIAIALKKKYGVNLASMTFI